MAGRIIWTSRATIELNEILLYWIERTKSKRYSRKLNRMFHEGAIYLSKNPETGRPTDFPNIRLRLIRDYYLFYQIGEHDIRIITIWDSRRNPDKFKL